jgi:acyl-CoA synthetase (AMP-forming)/AMP-acid ligase II
MYPGHWGRVTPEKAALVVAETGEVVTHGQLDERSTRLARAWRSAGLSPGDRVTVFMENHPRYLEVVWAALRSGVVITPVNRHLTAAEAGYIVDNCDAKALVTSRALAPVAADLLAEAPGCAHRLMADGPVAGFDSYEDALAAASPEPLAEDEPSGGLMLYSSGTTGRPKGIARPPSVGSASEGFAFARLIGALFQMDPETVYLSPAPLYHSAPLGFCLSVQALGGTVILMRSFDPVGALEAIDRHAVTHSQWVPTMFVRMLKLPEAERARFKLDSHQVAVHAAAPCPRPVKEAMFEWWGPIIHEYYGGSELNGLTYVGPQEWLSHPGTVGRAVLGTIHICDEGGRELPTGEAGLVYFELPTRTFHYHKDPAQTRSSQHPDHAGWTALGDVGYLDGDGYLYLTDRATFMIISGGVNIYPQEIEDCLILHPKVEDVAVFGVPNPEMGEEVKAVVQPAAGVEPGPALEQELLAFTRERLSHYKCPRSVDFEPGLPRLPTGKLYKRLLRDRYWGERASRIV